MIDLAFLVDMAQHLSDLNTKLEGKKQLANKMLEHIRSFNQKLDFFKSQLEKDVVVHFCTFKNIMGSFHVNSHLKVSIDVLKKPAEEFRSSSNENDKTDIFDIFFFFITNFYLLKLWLTLIKKFGGGILIEI